MSLPDSVMAITGSSLSSDILGADEKQMGQRVMKRRQKERQEDDKMGAKSNEG